MKVTILQALAKAKSKLNDVNKMTVENGEKMSKELESDAKNIEETIKRTMDKLDKKAANAHDKLWNNEIKYKNFILRQNFDHKDKNANKFADKYNIPYSKRDENYLTKIYDKEGIDRRKLDSFYD